MQCKAVLQILDIFCTSFSLKIEVITSLISIYLYLQKLSRRYQIRTLTFPTNHVIKSLLESKYISNSSHYHLFLENMISKQRLLIKSSIVNANNCSNSIFPFFNSLNSKLSPGSKLVDIFSSQFSFYQADCKDKDLKLPIFTNLTILFLMHYLVLRQSLLFQMQVLKTILPLLSHISTYIPTLLRKLFIMLLASHYLKLNFLLSDVVLIKLPKFLRSLTSLLSLI